MAYIIGVDPGPTTGLCGILVVHNDISRPDVVECSADATLAVLDGLAGPWIASTQGVVLAVELFVTRQRAGRLAHPQHGEITRNVLNQVQWFANKRHLQLEPRRAADVKPWATDQRLAAAGLLTPTSGHRHARDAGRHALFTAVKHGWLADPLSKKEKVR